MYNPEQKSQVLSKITALRTSGLTARQIVESLNNEKVQTSSGKKWSLNNLSFFMHANRKVVKAGSSKKIATKKPTAKPADKKTIAKSVVGTRVRKPVVAREVSSRNTDIATIKSLVAIRTITPVQTVAMIRSLLNA